MNLSHGTILTLIMYVRDSIVGIPIYIVGWTKLTNCRVAYLHRVASLIVASCRAINAHTYDNLDPTSLMQLSARYRIG